MSDSLPDPGESTVPGDVRSEIPLYVRVPCFVCACCGWETSQLALLDAHLREAHPAPAVEPEPEPQPVSAPEDADAPVPSEETS